MSILLVTATPMEMQAVLGGILPESEAKNLADSLSANRHATKHNTTPVTVNGHNLFLLTCGVGPVSAALHLGLAFGNLHRGRTPLGGVINMGIAGSYDAAHAPLGSVVQASCEIFPEYGLLTGQGISAHGLGFAQTEVPGGEVFDRLPPHGEAEAQPGLLLQNGLGNMGLNCHNFSLTGPSVTVSGVSGTLERAAELASLTGGLTENMEGFALALGAARCGLAFAEIRVVSNLVGHRPPHHWDIPGALAALTEAAGMVFSC